MDEMSNTIAALEAEYGIDSKVVVAVFLHLILKGKDENRRQLVDNLIWGFSMCDNRDQYTEEVCMSGAPPVYTVAGYPPLEPNDWDNLFNCLIASLEGNIDPYEEYVRA